MAFLLQLNTQLNTTKIMERSMSKLGLNFKRITRIFNKVCPTRQLILPSGAGGSTSKTQRPRDKCRGTSIDVHNGRHFISYLLVERKIDDDEGVSESNGIFSEMKQCKYLYSCELNGYGATLGSLPDVMLHVPVRLYGCLPQGSSNSCLHLRIEFRRARCRRVLQ